AAAPSPAASVETCTKLTPSGTREPPGGPNSSTESIGTPMSAPPLRVNRQRNGGRPVAPSPSRRRRSTSGTMRPRCTATPRIARSSQGTGVTMEIRAISATSAPFTATRRSPRATTMSARGRPPPSYRHLPRPGAGEQPAGRDHDDDAVVEQGEPLEVHALLAAEHRRQRREGTLIQAGRPPHGVDDERRRPAGPVVHEQHAPGPRPCRQAKDAPEVDHRERGPVEGDGSSRLAYGREQMPHAGRVDRVVHARHREQRHA